MHRNIWGGGSSSAPVEVIVTDGLTLTAAQCSSGNNLNNYGQAADITATLPAAAEGMTFSVILGTTVANFFRLDPAEGDSIYLDGVTTGDGKYVGIASAAVGNALSFRSFQTGATAWDWYCSAISGAWASESGVALLSQIDIFPLFGIKATLQDNLLIGG